MKIDEQIIYKIQKVSQGDLRKSINLLQTLSKINSSLLNEELIDEICGIIPLHVIIQFLEDCRTNDSRQLLATVNAFIEEGHSIKALVNQIGNYIISEDCSLEEKKKIKIGYLLLNTEKKLIQGGTPNIICLELASKISEILLKK